MPRNKQEQNEAVAQARQTEEAAKDTMFGAVPSPAPVVEETGTPEPRIDPPSEPMTGEAVGADGETVEQVGKSPDLPEDVPVQPGTALDPSLPPTEPHIAVIDPE